MDIPKKTKKISSRPKIESGFSWWKQRYSTILFLTLAAVGFLLIMTAAGSHFLSMEAKNGVDFNLRNIHPLTSLAEEGDRVSVELNVYTRVPGIYGLKVFSPSGSELASEMKLVRAENPDFWKITSEFETDGFGRYEVELSGIFNKHENQYYRAYFWVEDAAEMQAPVPGKISRETTVSEVSPSTLNPPEGKPSGGEPSDSGEDNTSHSSRDGGVISENISTREPVAEQVIEITVDSPAAEQIIEDPVDSGTGSSVEQGVNRNSEPAYETGTLYISSIPAGSTIYLNGHEMGRTPRTLSNLPAGTYRLRLSLYGYESFETDIRVVPGETTPIYQPLVETEKEKSDEDPMITALHIKAFIIFMIAGFIVYVVIYKLLKEM